MTSTTDEITNLRAGLDDIRMWCEHESRYGNDPTVIAVCKQISSMARRGLLTPRASKPLTVGEIMSWDDES